MTTAKYKRNLFRLKERKKKVKQLKINLEILGTF